MSLCRIAQDPLHTFPRNFPVDGELVANFVVTEFGKRHETTDTTDFCPRQLVMDFLRGNWYHEFWP